MLFIVVVLEIKVEIQRKMREWKVLDSNDSSHLFSGVFLPENKWKWRMTEKGCKSKRENPKSDLRIML